MEYHISCDMEETTYTKHNKTDVCILEDSLFQYSYNLKTKIHNKH